MTGLEGKVAIITGGARGQGAVEARLLAAAGCVVVICDVLEREGAELERELAVAGHACRFMPLDVTSPQAWSRTVSQIGAWRGRIDILVNNAGIINRTSIAETTPDAWSRLLQVNLTGAFLGIQAVAPAMRAAGGGAIVNISSNSGFSGHYDPAYTASKWGLRGLTRSAAMELVTDGIRVNAVCPGLIVTALNEGSPHLEPMIRMTPMGRAGTAEEVAQLVLFLVSDASSFITGEDFLIDGGFISGAAYRRVAAETGLLPDNIS